MKKLRDFARKRGVTDRAVQQLLKKYAAEFEGLVERRGHNGTWLSDEACELLISKMKINPVVVLENDQTEKIQKYEQRIKDLEDQVKQKEQYIQVLEVTGQKKSEQLLAMENDLKLIETAKKEQEEDIQTLQAELLKSNQIFFEKQQMKENEIQNLKKEKENLQMQSAEEIEELSQIKYELESKLSKIPSFLRWLYKI